MRWYFFRGFIYVKCNGSVLTLAVSCIPVWIKGFWPILDCVTHLTGAGEISLCVVTETSFTTDPLHTTLVYIYREKKRVRGDVCCLYNIIKGRAELMQSNCIIFTRQNVFFPFFSFKFCTSFTKLCSDYHEPMKEIFSPYIQDRSEKIFHEFDGEHAKVTCLALPAPPKYLALPVPPKRLTLPAPLRLFALPAPPRLPVLLGPPWLPDKPLAPPWPPDGLEPAWSVPPAPPWPSSRVPVRLEPTWFVPLVPPWPPSRVPVRPDPSWSVPPALPWLPARTLGLPEPPWLNPPSRPSLDLLSFPAGTGLASLPPSLPSLFLCFDCSCLVYCCVSVFV